MSDEDTELVKVYDFATGQTTVIPASELAAGMVRIRLNNSDEILWVDSAQLKAAQSSPRHPPFTGILREKIQYIEKSLAEVYPKTYADWEDGFRCDRNAVQEIDIWVRLSRCLNDFMEQHVTTADERREAFRILAACLNATPSTVFELIAVQGLDRRIAQQLVNAFFSDRTDSAN